MEIPDTERKRLAGTMAELKSDRQAFYTLWRELADYILPKRYVWLQTDKDRRARQAKNPYILDSTGTKAARTLASGMMNGITSPSRPWFKLTIPGLDDEGGPVTQWLDEVTRRMLMVMGQSNFYNAMAVLYLDLSVFGSAAALIYEDDDDVIRCYNHALGEYFFGQNFKLEVDTFAREYCQTVKQLVTNFGEDNVSAAVKDKWNRDGASRLAKVDCIHLVEPNLSSSVNKKFKYVETYWEAGMPQGKILAQRGFNELPGIFPRWELVANDSYGTSPAMDALGDIIQLQLETKRKAQALDKAINPPLVADLQLEHRPTSTLPNAITYVAGANSIGVKPMYQVQPPIQELTADIRDIQVRIRETFHNELFQMISQLETVRSATEIDARREEKLVLLGPVLERFENEALDPAIDRIFAIMQRRRMLPLPPEELFKGGQPIEVQYTSILAAAQRAVAAAPFERWVGFIGGLAGVVPQALDLPNWDETIRNYGLAIGVEARAMHTREVVAAIREQKQAQQAAAQSAAIANELAQGAQTLSETDVGGGSNALQQLLAQG